MISYAQFIPFNPALFGSSLFNLFCRSRKPGHRKILSQFGEIFLAGWITTTNLSPTRFHYGFKHSKMGHPRNGFSSFILSVNLAGFIFQPSFFFYDDHFPCYQPSQVAFYLQKRVFAYQTSASLLWTCQITCSKPTTHLIAEN